MPRDQTPIRFQLQESTQTAAVVMGLANAAVAMGRAPSVNPLPIDYVHQTASNWCWATCGTMVSRYFSNREIKICEVVSKIITDGNCCDGSPDESDTSLSYHNATFNRTCTVSQVAELAGKLGLDVKHVGGPLDIDALHDQIVNEGSPIEVAFAWWGGGGHVVLTIGVNLDAQTVRICDPWPDIGEHIVAFDELQAAYGKGKWFDSWTNYETKSAGV